MERNDNKIPKNADITPYIEMSEYQQGKPAILNHYFKTNLLSFIDKLPEQKTFVQKKEEDPPIFQKPLFEKNQQNKLQNISIAIKHEIDSLGNDAEINQYSISKTLLGKGSHCFVKLGKKDGKQYAIKIVSLDRIRKKFYIKEQSLIRMINLEVSILKKLVHPHIIKIEQAIHATEKEKIFLILEYCSQGSVLKNILQSASIPDDEWTKLVQKYFIQIVKALNHIHRNNIIHRDIKSQNLMLSEKGDIKVIDFNISSETPPDGKIKLTGKFVGTKTYAPPELVLPSNKEKIVNGRLIDVWALGITLLEMLERRHPFQCNTLQELINLIKKPVRISEAYDSDLKNLLNSMLNFENSKRIDTGEILKHAWLEKKQERMKEIHLIS